MIQVTKNLVHSATKTVGFLVYHEQAEVRLALESCFSTIGRKVTAVKELVEIIAKALVDHPEQVRIAEIHGGHTLVIELRTAKEDVGKIIGKRGQNAQAIRTILNAASAKLGKRVILEIID